MGWRGVLMLGAAVVVAAWLGHGGDKPAPVAVPLYDVSAPHAAPIPAEALRLRVVANSDSPADQALKLRVRDAVVRTVAGVVAGAQSAADARARVQRALPQIQAAAAAVVAQAGVSYGVRTDVGPVPFPTKVYGNQVYPAGTYEALRVTLGAGRGQNWWCVLFPPLCFIDLADGSAVPNTGGFPDLPPLTTVSVPGPDGRPQPVQVRLAVLDYGEELWRALQRAW
ncbi:MAG: stage II sporulation protein R [Alicyclobacillus sp.]|nr:stage II sporulation protein R [Alicyclobacillus sp.]